MDEESLSEQQEKEFFAARANEAQNEISGALDEDADPIPLESTPITDEFISAQDEETGVGEAAFDGEN